MRSKSVREAVLRDYASGYLVDQLMDAHAVGRSTVYRWLRQCDVKKRRRCLDAACVKQLMTAGFSQEVIAAKMGVKRMAVRTCISNFKAGNVYECRCLLFECQKRFTSTKFKRFCCFEHKNRHRARKGKKVAWTVCALPECEKRLLSIGGSVRWCCKGHHETHRRRLHKWGLYRRIAEGATERCLACGERVILDEHHVNHRGKSLPGPKVWLCPTHHMAIHRGLARIEGGKYIMLVPAIADGLRQKWPKLLEQLKAGCYPRTAPSGKSGPSS